MSSEDIDPLAIPDNLSYSIPKEPMLLLPVVQIKQEIRTDDDLELRDTKVDVKETIVQIKDEIKEELIEDADDWEGKMKVHAVGPEQEGSHVIEDEEMKIDIDDDEDEGEEGGEKCCGSCTVEERWLTCPAVIRILDTIVPNAVTNIAERSKATAPKNIIDIKQFGGNNGVFALKAMREGIMFGPLDGVNAVPSTTGCVWRLKDEKFVEADDGQGCNWMQFVNIAKNKSCKNIDIFQYKENVYYRTCTRIEKGQQLFIHFDVNQELNENSECYFKPVIVEEIKNSYACTFCCLGFNSEARLAKHKTVCVDVLVMGAVIEEMIQCVFCKVFMDRREYSKYHLDTCLKKYQRKLSATERIPESSTNEHRILGQEGTATYKRYICSECHIVTNKRSAFLSHIRYVHGKFKCPDCDYVAHTRTLLKKHEKESHYVCELHSCSQCDYKTTYKGSLKQHFIRRHTIREKAIYTCPECSFQTSLKSTFLKHNVMHDSRLTFQCTMCSCVKFATKEELAEHKRSKHTLHQCQQCEYNTYEKSRLERHILTHNKEKIFNCPTCVSRFTSEIYLKRHINNIHQDKEEHKPYSCKICKKRFKSTTGFNVHIKKKHGGIEKCPNCTEGKANKDCKLCDPKPFKCTKCDYAVDSKPNLKQHYYVHDDIKPFQCDSCSKQFRTNGNLQVHMRVHDDT